MGLSAAAARTAAQVWNGTVVVPEAQKATGNFTFQYATGWAGTHAALTPAKAPSSGSRSGEPSVAGMVEDVSAGADLPGRRIVQYVHGASGERQDVRPMAP